MDRTDTRIVAIADQVVADHERQQRHGLSHAAAREATAAEFESRYGRDSEEATIARYYRDEWGPDLLAGPGDA